MVFLSNLEIGKQPIGKVGKTPSSNSASIQPAYCIKALKALKIPKKMLTFQRRAQKSQTRAKNTFYSKINLWTTWRLIFITQKSRRNNNKISTGCFIFNVCQKRRFLLKLFLSDVSSTLTWNARLIPKVSFDRVF